MLKVLHTSDWHIGRALYGKNRYYEFEQFLDWLVALIDSESIDVLLISGDVFDTTTPSNKAQELYYFFLARIAKTQCREVIITAGNHDSPTFLTASKTVLKALNVDVIGFVNEDVSREVIEIKNAAGVVELLVCAVPYLREREIRVSEIGESIEDRAGKLRAGIQQHYCDVCELAKEKNPNVPLIAMGHLFAAGGSISEESGVRELYVGTLAHVDAGALPKVVDYYALGHLHIPQCVAKSQYIRYSGSPIAMGFGEAEQQKVVVELSFSEGEVVPVINEIKVPVFQRLKKIAGELDVILEVIEELKVAGEAVWLEIDYTGKDIVSDLSEVIDKAVAGSLLEVRRVRNNAVLAESLRAMEGMEDLELSEIDDMQVFQRCLDMGGISEEQAAKLLVAYQEIKNELYETDDNAL